MSKQRVFVIGPYPPPVHGMAKNTKAMADDLSLIADVVRVDISPGGLVRGAQYHLTKLKKVLKGGWDFLSRGRGSVLYIPTDAGWGILYTTFFVLIARLLSSKIYIHHRSFAYIDSRSALMDVQVRLAGSGAVQIFLCKQMAEKFSRLYSGAYGMRVISNANHVSPIQNEEVRARVFMPSFVIGHMSNLGEEKGLLEVIEVFRVLLSHGRDVTLVLGGPPASPQASQLLEAAKSEFGEKVTLLGRVDGGQKSAFFRSIDVFLFPTKYKNEAQPNVVFESLSFAVPVVALDRGCISSDLTSQGGAVYKDEESYVRGAVEFISMGIELGGDYVSTKMEALALARSHSSQAVIHYKDLLKEIANS